MSENIQLDIFLTTYQEMVELWKLMCVKHEELFHLTCQEYVLLLKSEVNELEIIIDKKIKIINEINFHDERRKSLLLSLGKALDINENIKVSKFIDMIVRENIDQEIKTFQKYNMILIDLINKLKDQNKKNQLILNKSLINLKELREKLLGEDSLKTYDMRGHETNGINK